MRSKPRPARPPPSVGSPSRSAGMKRKSLLMLTTRPTWLLSIWPPEKCSLEIDAPTATAPKSQTRSSVRAQRQAAAGRRAAAATAAGIEAELDADRADQPLPPRDLAAEAEEAAVAAADGAVDGGSEREAADRRRRRSGRSCRRGRRAGRRPESGPARSRSARATREPPAAGSRSPRAHASGGAATSATTARMPPARRPNADAMGRLPIRLGRGFASSQSTAAWARARTPSGKAASSM